MRYWHTRCHVTHIYICMYVCICIYMCQGQWNYTLNSHQGLTSLFPASASISPTPCHVVACHAYRPAGVHPACVRPRRLAACRRAVIAACVDLQALDGRPIVRQERAYAEAWWAETEAERGPDWERRAPPVVAAVPGGDWVDGGGLQVTRGGQWVGLG